MPPKIINPIKEKLLKIILSGRMTKEKICVACGMAYPTFMNALNREHVSYVTRHKLRYSGVINDADLKAYQEWTLKHGPRKRRGGRRKKQEAVPFSPASPSSEKMETKDENKSPDLKNEFSEPLARAKRDGGQEV